MRTGMRGWVLPWLLVVLGSLGPGCAPDPGPDPEPGPCGLKYLGSPNSPPSFTLLALGPDMKSRTLEDGGSVSLITPLQGGLVAFLGVGGATNLDPCAVTLRAAVRDPVSHQLQLDARTVNLMLDAQGQGMSDELDFSTFANVPMCPNQWSSEDVFDQDYTLTVTLTDRHQRSATQTITIRPACDVPGREDYCRCICREGYKLGDPC